MDGNGRWGLKHKNSRNEGHKVGLKTVEKVIKETIKQKIKHLTLYAFSTENWKRPKKEINYLFNLLETFLLKKINDLHKQNIKLNIIGVKNFSKKCKTYQQMVDSKACRAPKPVQAAALRGPLKETAPDCWRAGSARHERHPTGAQMARWRMSR